MVLFIMCVLTIIYASLLFISASIQCETSQCYITFNVNLPLIRLIGLSNQSCITIKPHNPKRTPQFLNLFLIVVTQCKNNHSKFGVT